MRKSRVVGAAFLLAGGMLLSPTSGFADPPPDHGWRNHERDRHEEHDRYRGENRPGPAIARFRFEHRDTGHFTQSEHSNWVSGRWHHGWHEGRLGWWWLAGGGWFFYNAPVYPYPVVVSNDYDYDDDYGPGLPGQYWYYCSNPPGYYPYVQYCSVPWQPVPAGEQSTAPGYGPAPQPDKDAQPGPGDQGDENSYPSQGPQQQAPDNDSGPPDQPPQNYDSGPPPDDQGPPQQNDYNGPN